MEITTEQKNNLYKAVLGLVIILGLFFAVKILSVWSEYRMIGASDSHTITLTGHGEVQAAPDIATISFTLEKTSKTAKEAQDAVAALESKAIEALKANGVEDKDIKTQNASVYPQYDYKQAICPTQAPMVDGGTTTPYYCGGGKQVLTGYTASESITAKVRVIDNAGKVMQSLGTAGVSNISGPNFEIDNEEGIKAEARKKAIDDAREKAEILAKDLGVHLGRVSSFNESTGGYPMYYAKDMVMNAEVASAPRAASLPQGENTVSSDITITYEIR